MHLIVNQNYQTPSFCAKTHFCGLGKKILSALGLTTAAIGASAVKEGMSADELNGRLQVNPNSEKSNENLFNKEVSFNYFANGKLKNVPEYIEAGKKAISELNDEEKGNYYNVLQYQEEIVDKILSEDALINNPSIRNGLYELINYKYFYYVPKNVKWFIEETMDVWIKAQLELLDIYAKDTKMQENEYINENICKYVIGICRYWPGALGITQFLKDNVDTQEKQIFDKSLDLISKGVYPSFIAKVLSNKLFYENEELYSVLCKVTDMFAADDVSKTLDIYANEFSDSKLVSENMANILITVFENKFNSHYYSKDNPYELRAKKMMQELAETEKAKKQESKSE